jgi:hypothetical protein
MEEQVIEVGIASSLTLISLTVATILLLRSFYKRQKRLEERRRNEEENQ